MFDDRSRTTSGFEPPDWLREGLGPSPGYLGGSGDSHGPKPYKFIGSGDSHGPRPGCTLGQTQFPTMGRGRLTPFVVEPPDWVREGPKRHIKEWHIEEYSSDPGSSKKPAKTLSAISRGRWPCGREPPVKRQTPFPENIHSCLCVFGAGAGNRAC
jgi:hypothetical protein